MTKVRLSKRMQALADMVCERRVADVGCDHAFVSIYLIQSGKADHVFAMDVRKGPLAIADANITEYALKDRIDIRLSDGLDRLLVGEASCVLLAGMGGRLIVDILRRAKEHTDAGVSLVLQPQSELWEVRAYLSEIGYSIVREKMLVEDEKYYTVMRAVPEINLEKCEKEDIPKDISYLYGEYLIRKKDSVLRQYLLESRDKNMELIKKLAHIHTGRATERKKELEKENGRIAQALFYYGEKLEG